MKKLTCKTGWLYDPISYIDGMFEYRTDGSRYQNIVHIMDNKSRIAMIRIGNNFGDSTPDVQYNLEDNLGSSVMHLKDDGATLNKEEYYPFGETSFGSYAEKRYKYCGKERDKESGLYYYGARYYSPWICKFVSVDPLARDYPFYGPYDYAGNKPVSKIDIDGMQENGKSKAPINTATNGAKKALDKQPTLPSSSLESLKNIPSIDPYNMFTAEVGFKQKFLPGGKAGVNLGPVKVRVEGHFFTVGTTVNSKGGSTNTIQVLSGNLTVKYRPAGTYETSATGIYNNMNSDGTSTAGMGKVSSKLEITSTNSYVEISGVMTSTEGSKKPTVTYGQNFASYSDNVVGIEAEIAVVDIKAEANIEEIGKVVYTLGDIIGEILFGKEAQNYRDMKNRNGQRKR